MPKHDLAESPSTRMWTRSDAYVQSLARRRTARKGRSDGTRSEPEQPRLLLSTIPFLALIVALGLLAAAIMVIAWPKSRPQPPPLSASHEKGVAAKGWLQEAERDFHR